MSKRDYYDILGVSKDASQEDIRKAYRALAKKYHPDVSKEENAEAKFKEVQEAYDVLGNEEKRKNYDRFGAAGANANFGSGFEGFSGFGGFGGFSDIFDSFFGGGQRRVDPNAPRRGRDIERPITVTFEEAVLGTKKDLQLEVEVDCDICNGSGAESMKDIEKCKTCNGHGYVTVEQRTILGSMRSQETCHTCGGSGKTIKNKCSSCRGTGRKRVVKNVTVTVPAGIDNNMNLRMTGYGEGGSNGGENGDLYLRFRVKPHKVFERKKDDILLTVPISFAQAALGDKIEIPTIYGNVDLNIPAGTQPGTVMKLRGKGVQQVNGSRKGDQLVTLKVEVPKNLTEEQKKAIKEFSNLEGKQTSWDKFKNLFKM
jgi:molecular chaperone DnaJ